MSERSPGEQGIGLLKRDEQPSLTLDPARACFDAAKSLRFSGLGVYNRKGRRPKSEILVKEFPQE